MSITIAPPDHNVRERLKECLIFRVSQYDGHRELADDCGLKGEAVRYADLVADAEQDYAGVHYEVRELFTGALLHSTEDMDDSSEDDSDDSSDKETEAKTCTPAHQIPAATP